MNEEQLLGRITAMEKRQKRTSAIAALVAVLVLGVLIFQARQIRRLQNLEKLRVRELSVVDANGTERVLIAAPLPEPSFHGRRGKRGGVVSGIIISDATGTERGGYVTADGYANAMLTLDAPGRQTVLLLAEPDGSTMFRIWNGDKGSVTAGVSDNPYLNVKQNGKPVLVTPPGNPQSLRFP